MPKFYCEYCSIYLTHSSPAGRKQHSQGRKHINAKVDYYQKLVRERFFQPPPFLNPQMPLFPGSLRPTSFPLGFPMMGLMPGFPGFQPGMAPMAGPIPPMPIPGNLPGPMPMAGPLPIPLPGSVPGVPVIPPEMPNGKPELNKANPPLIPSSTPPT